MVQNTILYICIYIYIHKYIYIYIKKGKKQTYHVVVTVILNRKSIQN